MSRWSSPSVATNVKLFFLHSSGQLHRLLRERRSVALKKRLVRHARRFLPLSRRWMPVGGISVFSPLTEGYCRVHDRKFGYKSACSSLWLKGFFFPWSVCLIVQEQWAIYCHSYAIANLNQQSNWRHESRTRTGQEVPAQTINISDRRSITSGQPQRMSRLSSLNSKGLPPR